MSVSLLLPLNGANDGTVFTDYSPSPKTITRHGDVKTVTTQSKFYGSSAYFDGSGDALVVADTFGSGDFTLDFWARGENIPITFFLFDARNADIDESGLALYFRSNRKLTIGGGSPFVATEGTTVLQDATWYHCRLTRSGNMLYAYLNGVQEMTRAWSANLARNLVIGCEYDRTNGFSAGYIQDVMLRKGEALVGNFTPPGKLYNTLSGVIRDRFGNPCQRKVYAVSRPIDTTAPQILAHGLSDPTTGAYEMVIPSGEEVTRVVVSEDDDSPLLNDLVDRVIPA